MRVTHTHAHTQTIHTDFYRFNSFRLIFDILQYGILFASAKHSKSECISKVTKLCDINRYTSTSCPYSCNNLKRKSAFSCLIFLFSRKNCNVNDFSPITCTILRRMLSATAATIRKKIHVKSKERIHFLTMMNCKNKFFCHTHTLTCMLRLSFSFYSNSFDVHNTETEEKKLCFSKSIKIHSQPSLSREFMPLNTYDQIKVFLFFYFSSLSE